MDLRGSRCLIEKGNRKFRYVATIDGLSANMSLRGSRWWVIKDAHSVPAVVAANRTNSSNITPLEARFAPQ